MKDKPNLSPEAAAAHLKDGMTVMIGGFMGVGSPHTIIDAIVASGVQDLTLIANDTGFPDFGCGKLVVSRSVRKIIASHVGTNKETGRQMSAGEIEVELIPQGTLAEQIRAAGAGLGGILTPTGVGTVVAEGKEVISVEGVPYLLETPLRADVAFIAAHTVDTAGNVVYRGATRNFNTLMAMAAETVIVEAETMVPAGSIDPDQVMTSRIFIDAIVKGDAA